VTTAPAVSTPAARPSAASMRMPLARTRKPAPCRLPGLSPLHELDVKTVLVQRRVHKAELAEQGAHAADLALQAEREAEKAEALIAAEKAESAALLEGEQKAARDIRYAARKAAKKERRRGY